MQIKQREQSAAGGRRESQGEAAALMPSLNELQTATLLQQDDQSDVQMLESMKS